MSSPNSIVPVAAAFVALISMVVALEWAGRTVDNPARRISIVLTSDTGSLYSEPSMVAAPLDDAHHEARDLVKRGDLGKAIERLRTVARMHPDDAQVWSELGSLLLTARRNRQAVEALEHAWRLDDSNPWVALRSGVAHLRIDVHDVAEERFRQALALRPQFHDATVALARLLREQSRLPEAIALLEPVSVKGSNERRARALAELGRAYLQAGREAQAEVAFAQAIDRAPAAVRVRLNIANGYAHVGTVASLQRAVRILDRALLVAPGHAPLYSALGAAQEALGEQALARESYELAVQQDPTYAKGRRRLARLLSQLGQHQAAHEHLDVLLESDPEDPSVHFLAGLVSDAAGRSKRALAAYERAIHEADGHYPEAMLNIGTILREQGAVAAAIEVYETAIEQRPGYTAARNNLALALADAGRLDEAVDTLRKLVFDDPDYATGWFNLGRALTRSGLHSQAVVALERAVALQPTNWAAMQSLGASQRRADQVDAALRTYDRLLDKQPRLAAGWYNRGIALEAAQRPKAAVRSYRRVLRLEPTHRSAQRRLARLVGASDPGGEG